MKFFKVKKFFVRKSISVALAILLLVSSLFVFTACSEDTMLTVDGQKVSYDMIRSFVKNHLAAYSEEELKDEAVREEIRNAVLSDIKNAYVIKVVAEELDVKLDKEAKAAVKEELEYYKSADNFKELLEQMNATEDVLEELIKISALDDMVFDSLTENAYGGRFASDNDTIDADLAAGDWYAAEFVVLIYDSVNHDKRKAEMELARQAVMKGESFKSAISKISSSYSSEYYLTNDGCFTSTIYAEDFEETVKGLSIGEVSSVFETYTSDGYSCLMFMRRNAISDDYVDENYDEIISYYLAREYTEYMTERVEALEIKYTDEYKDFDILDIE